MTEQQIDRERLRADVELGKDLTGTYRADSVRGYYPSMDRIFEAVPQLLDQLATAEARIRDLTQEAKDERGAALDLIEQVRIRDARIKAVRDVLDQAILRDGTEERELAHRIRRALDSDAHERPIE